METEKTCTKCKKSKLINQFPKAKQNKDNLSSWCHFCHCEAAKTRYNRLKKENKKWDIDNICKKCNFCNQEKLLKEFGPAAGGSFGRSHKCRDCYKIYNSTPKRRKYFRERKRKLMAKDPAFKFKNRTRESISKLLKGKIKSSNTEGLLGCSFAFLREYLESKFKPGMTWENYGRGGWHVDHIIPCVAFDLSKEQDQKKCFHYTNLQPLWEFDNLSKNDKIGGKRYSNLRQDHI